MRGIKAFYPLCGPILDRRQFLKLSLMGAVGSALIPDLLQAATDPIRAFIDRHAAVADDPWRLAHGVRGVGTALRLPDGRNAVDHLLSGSVTRVEVGGKPYLLFPRKLEVHTNMFVKTLLEAGVEHHHPFRLNGRDHTFDELLRGAKALFRFDPKSFERNDLAWSLITFAELKANEWENVYGERIALREAAAFGLKVLQEASADVRSAFIASRPLSRKAPIHDFTCGGMHLIYSLLVAARHGYLSADDREGLRDQVRVLIFRLWADPDLIDRFYRKLGASPGVEAFQDDAKLKVLGHALECLGYAARHRLYQPTEAERERMTKVKAEVRRLAASFSGQDLQPVKQKQFYLYQQIVGDACHAYRGLRLSA